MPVLTIPRLLFSLLSLAVLAGAIYILWSWASGYEVRGADGVLRHVRGPQWQLYAGLALGAWSFLGRFVVLALMRKGPDPQPRRREMRTLTAPDGSKLALEITGRSDGPVVVLTHGWGMDATFWEWTRPALERRFRVVAWDLPGLGRSSRPSDGRLTVERFAEALGAVLDATAERPAVLVGHSIGGMITQTLFRVKPELAERKVAGVVLANTTYDNPLYTMWLSRLWLALQKPVLEPISWLAVALSPLLWLINWQSYLSGGAQLAMRLTGFGRYATARQVDTAARLACQSSPGVQAKGNLAMFHWHAGEALRRIRVPALVIAGTRDIVTLPTASEVIASRTGGARLVTVEGAGHMGPLETAAAYNREIEFFAEQAFLTPRQPAARGAEQAGREGPRPGQGPSPLH